MGGVSVMSEGRRRVDFFAVAAGAGWLVTTVLFAVSELSEASGAPCVGVANKGRFLGPWLRRLFDRSFTGAVISLVNTLAWDASSLVFGCGCVSGCDVTASPTSADAGALGISSAWTASSCERSRPRPPRFTGTDLVMTLDLRASGCGLRGKVGPPALVMSGSAATGASFSPLTASFAAFLRAVRLAPPRERRCFLFAGSNSAPSIIDKASVILSSNASIGAARLSIVATLAATATLATGCSGLKSALRSPRRPRFGRLPRATCCARNSSGDKRAGRSFPVARAPSTLATAIAEVEASPILVLPMSTRSCPSSSGPGATILAGTGSVASRSSTSRNSAATFTRWRLRRSNRSRVATRNCRCSGAAAFRGRWPKAWLSPAHSLRNRSKSASKYVRVNFSHT